MQTVPSHTMILSGRARYGTIGPGGILVCAPPGVKFVFCFCFFSSDIERAQSITC